jgi:hypothetical protein
MPIQFPLVWKTRTLAAPLAMVSLAKKIIINLAIYLERFWMI